MTIHFNETLLIGLCLIPGSLIVAFVAGFLSQSLELGALAVMVIAGGVTLAAGLIMTFIGIGMNIH